MAIWYSIICRLFQRSYVLIHHVMGDIDGYSGAWGYVEGGMGSVSDAIANCARSHGASIFTNKVSLQACTLILE